MSFARPEPPKVSKLKYKVMKEGKEIGSITAALTTQGERMVYDVETKMVIKVLINQKVNYTSKVVYQNGILQHSDSKSFLNDRLYNTCETTLLNGRYQIQTDKNNFFIDRNITYSGAMLYFKEPSNINVVYSEMTGQDNAMRKTGSGIYMLTNGKSKKQNKYWYKGGILEKAIINHTLIDIEIQRVN